MCDGVFALRFWREGGFPGLTFLGMSFFCLVSASRETTCIEIGFDYVHRMSSYHPCFGLLFYLCLMYYFFGAPFLWFGVLIFFILFLPIPTYLGLRGIFFFLLGNFSMCMLALVLRIRIANPYEFNH